MEQPTPITKLDSILHERVDEIIVAEQQEHRVITAKPSITSEISSTTTRCSKSNDLFKNDVPYFCPSIPSFLIDNEMDIRVMENVRQWPYPSFILVF
jgi:hypothetical protein